MERTGLRWVESIVDALGEGVIVIDSSREVVVCNVRARSLLGLVPVVGPGHPAGHVLPGDVCIICDTCLGADDGGLTPEDLPLVGVSRRAVKRGDPFIAVGALGAMEGSARVATGTAKSTEPLAFRGHRIDKAGRKHGVFAEIDHEGHHVLVLLDGKPFEFNYMVAVGFAVILEPAQLTVRFYQAPGYTARGEQLKNILLGKGFRAKEPGKVPQQVVGTRIEHICKEGLNLEDLDLILQGKKGAITPRQGFINGIPLKFWVMPLVSMDKVEGAVLVLEQDHDHKGASEMPPCSTVQIARETARVSSPAFTRILGNSEGMRQCISLAERLAQTKGNILITGESGTGKNLLARAIHEASSRRSGPFVIVNCAAIPQNLFESELFGCLPGAFTGASPRGQRGKFKEADGGTLFLDEVSEIPLACQAKLLHAIEEGIIQPLGGSKAEKVNVRIIAATNKDLRALMQQGAFRPDLYYRLNVFCLEIPPLRERKEDIVELTNSLLTVLSATSGKALSISRDALNAFLNYSWPGNVRELQNVLERAAAFCKGQVIGLDDLPIEVREGCPTTGEGTLGCYFRVARANAERSIIEEALKRCAGNRTKAARLLGIARSTLYKKIPDQG